MVSSFYTRIRFYFIAILVVILLLCASLSLIKYLNEIRKKKTLIKINVVIKLCFSCSNFGKVLLSNGYPHTTASREGKEEGKKRKHRQT